MKKLSCKITSMAKLIQEKDQKNIEFVSQIQKEHEEVYDSFILIKPILQKTILTKSKNKHFDIKRRKISFII